MQTQKKSNFDKPDAIASVEARVLRTFSALEEHSRVRERGSVLRRAHRGQRVGAVGQRVCKIKAG